MLWSEGDIQALCFQGGSQQCPVRVFFSFFFFFASQFMLMSRRYSVVTDLAAEHLTPSGAKPPLYLLKTSGGDGLCLLRWRQARRSTVLCKSCAKRIKSLWWRKPPGIGHCILSVGCYIMNMHMAQSVCVCACWCVWLYVSLVTLLHISAWAD